MLKKKIMCVMLISLIITAITGCGENSADAGKNIDDNSSANVSIKETWTEKSLPMTIDQIKLDLVISDKEYITDIKTLTATLTNNSNMPIKRCDVIILNKDTNENSYLFFANTIMPKETSPITETMAPVSGKKEDIEIIKYELVLIDKDGKEVFLHYDPKLNTYEWS